MKALNAFPPLLARATLGTAFVTSGVGKFKHLSKDEEYFASLGIPAPRAMTPLVAAVEVACGSLLLLGLFTRASSLPLMPVMGVAITTARRKEFHSFSDLTGVFEFSYLVLLSYLFVEGAGAISLDEVLKRANQKAPKGAPHAAISARLLATPDK